MIIEKKITAELSCNNLFLNKILMLKDDVGNYVLSKSIPIWLNTRILGIPVIINDFIADNTFHVYFYENSIDDKNGILFGKAFCPFIKRKLIKTFDKIFGEIVVVNELLVFIFNEVERELKKLNDVKKL